jgi:hypothetical protein
MDQPQVVPDQPGPTSDPRGWSGIAPRLPTVIGADQPGQPFSPFSHADSEGAAWGHHRHVRTAHVERSHAATGQRGHSARTRESAIVVAARLSVLAPGWHGELVDGRPVRAWFNGRPADPNDWERAVELVLRAFAERRPDGAHARAYAAIVSARRADERIRTRGQRIARRVPHRLPMHARSRRHRLCRAACTARASPKASDDEPPAESLDGPARAASLFARRLA